jgi:M6 family metalloprotease-like protein
MPSRFIMRPPKVRSGMWRRILTKVRESVNSRLAAAFFALGVAMPGPTPARETPRTIRVLAIVAGFPDRAPARDRAWYLAEPDGLLPRFERYWTEVSAGRLVARVHLGEHQVRVSRPRVTYVQRPGALALEALSAFRAETESAADRSALEESDQLLVFFAGTGRESHVGKPPNDPWSNYVGSGLQVGSIRGASVIAEAQVEPFSPFGVLCHEFGHQLGLPELYAPGGATHEGIGVWGLMGQGTWIDKGRHPPHPSAWSKLTLGWVDARVVDETTTGVRLPPVVDTPIVVKVPMPGAPASEYLLLEHRTRRGADVRLPGEGLLVWHVDERRRSFRNAQSNPAHKMVHLVEADGRGDLDRGHAAGGNRGDATDPWRPASAMRRRLGTASALLGSLALAAAVFRLGCAFSAGAVLIRLGLSAIMLWGAWALLRRPVCGPAHPGMAPYDGRPGRVVVRNVRADGGDLLVDVVLLPDRPPPRPRPPVAGARQG